VHAAGLGLCIAPSTFRGRSYTPNMHAGQAPPHPGLPSLMLDLPAESRASLNAGGR